MKILWPSDIINPPKIDRKNHHFHWILICGRWQTTSLQALQSFWLDVLTLYVTDQHPHPSGRECRPPAYLKGRTLASLEDSTPSDKECCITELYNTARQHSLHSGEVDHELPGSHLKASDHINRSWAWAFEENGPGTGAPLGAVSTSLPMYLTAHAKF